MTAALIVVGIFAILYTPWLLMPVAVAALIRGVVLAERDAREGRWTA